MADVCLVAPVFYLMIAVIVLGWTLLILAVVWYTKRNKSGGGFGRRY